jgi:5'-nucleotidase
MPQSLEGQLVVGISSRALFDLAEANKVFEQEGLSAYRAYQREHEHDVLEPGTAYALVKGLLGVNELAGQPLVEVIIFSRNDADSAMRVLHSVEAHGLPITRGVFRGGRDPWPLLPAMGCSVFLSAEPSQVLKALEQGVASALIMPGVRLAREDITEVRIAFDGDAVLFDAASQQVFDELGLDAFHEHEATHADVPLTPGPFRPFLDGLARIQAHFGGTSPIRTALVTARAAPAHYRVVNTLRAWGVTVDETYFLGGLDKTRVLKAFGAHIFFDDQRDHAERAAVEVPAAQVLWSEDDLPPARSPAKAAAVPGRGKPRAAAPATKKRATPRAVPRPAGRSAPARSGR